jgi:hypothetical protein
MERKFKIDFFELAFLVEACIPPVPIARGMFWDDVINQYYHEMTSDERVRLYDWIHKSWVYSKGLKEGIEDIKVFEARFDPTNQYKVYTKNQVFDTFLYKGYYYTENYPGSRAKSIDTRQILKVENIKYDGANT